VSPCLRVEVLKCRAVEVSRNYLELTRARRSRWRVYGRSLAAFAGSNTVEGMDVCLRVSVVCCQVEVSATGRSLVQRRSTEFGVSECDLESSTKRKPNGDWCAMQIKIT
jgi:hypothetical protein